MGNISGWGRKLHTGQHTAQPGRRRKSGEIHSEINFPSFHMPNPFCELHPELRSLALRYLASPLYYYPNSCTFLLAWHQDPAVQQTVDTYLSTHAVLELALVRSEMYAIHESFLIWGCHQRYGLQYTVHLSPLHQWVGWIRHMNHQNTLALPAMGPCEFQFLTPQCWCQLDEE